MAHTLILAIAGQPTTPKINAKIRSRSKRSTYREKASRVEDAILERIDTGIAAQAYAAAYEARMAAAWREPPAPPGRTPQTERPVRMYKARGGGSTIGDALRAKGVDLKALLK